MKENYTKFICDECKKEIEVEGDSTGAVIYPYSEGWKFLYRMDFKVASINRSINNKHFCTAKCMLNHISNEIRIK